MTVMQRLMHGRFQRTFAKVQLPLSQLHLLMVVAHNAPIQPKGLAAKLCLTPGAITQLIEAMENAGFIERKSDSKDRRTVCVSLTRKGKRKVVAVKKAREQIMQDAMQTLDDSELRAFANIQQKIIAHFSGQEAPNSQIK